MKHMRMFGFFFVAMLLVACTDSETPSDKEASDVIYGIYLRQPIIVKKTDCEMTPELEHDEGTSVWLIEYRFDNRFKTYARTIMKNGDDWVLHGHLPFCPGDPPSQ